MKPTTTPGNANGKVSSASSVRLSGNSRRASSKPAITDTTSVAAVTAAESSTVAPRLDM